MELHSKETKTGASPLLIVPQSPKRGNGDLNSHQQVSHGKQVVILIFCSFHKGTSLCLHGPEAGKVPDRRSLIL